MGVWRRLATATARKMPATTAVTIHLRLIRTRRYSRSVDSCAGNTLYSAELIGLKNSAGSPGRSSRNPSPFRGSLLRGTRGPNDIFTPPPQARCYSAPHPAHSLRYSLAPAASRADKSGLLWRICLILASWEQETGPKFGACRYCLGFWLPRSRHRRRAKPQHGRTGCLRLWRGSPAKPAQSVTYSQAQNFDRPCPPT